VVLKPVFKPLSLNIKGLKTSLFEVLGRLVQPPKAAKIREKSRNPGRKKQNNINDLIVELDKTVGGCRILLSKLHPFNCFDKYSGRFCFYTTFLLY